MLKQTLQIKAQTEAVRPVSAWFLSGADASAWLEQLCHSTKEQAALRLYPVPHDRQPQRLAGVLVTGVEVSLTLPPRALRFGREGERLYLPVDATLEPPLTKDELASLCLYPVMIWHPVHGLTGFDEANALRLVDLLNSPSWRDDDWSAAHPGMPETPPISSIALRMPPEDLKLFFKEESEDIGGKSPKELPPVPGEPKDGPLDKLRRGVQGGLARGAQGVSGMFSAAAGSAGWMGDLANWAGQQMQGLSEELNKIRNKELLRLMELLKTDPEAGLRHAIPLSGIGAHRGIAPPGGRLMQRNPNFSLNGLGGGGLADFWDIPGQWQAELTQLYQRMANRELSLHRYRRAAYIYAELLGDLSAAAAALKQGKFYAEAAVLYRDRLHRPLEAAACLAEGGFFKQALKIYLEHGSYLEAAALHRKLGETADAEECVRKLVTVRQNAGDFLGAADLLERELGQIDEALEMLDSAWPDSGQAVACKRRWFDTLGRLGRHEETVTALVRIRRDHWNAEQTLRLADVLLTVVEQYPDHAARHSAADISRIHISKQLVNRQSRHLPDYVQHLRKLAPNDKLLNRDGSRFLNNRSAPPKIKATTPALHPVGAPVLSREFSLPAHVTWLDAKAGGPVVFFVGIQAKTLHCMRGNWEEVIQGMTWEAPHLGDLPFCIIPNDRAEAIIGPVHDRRFTPKYLPSNSRFGMPATEAGTPNWMPTSVLAVYATTSSIWVLRWASSRFILASHQHTGELVHQEDLTENLTAVLVTASKTGIVQMVALKDYVVIGLGNSLLLRQSGSTMEIIECSSAITGLVPSSPYARPFVLVQCEQSVDLVWLDKSEVTNVADDVQDPRCTLTTEGQVVVLAGSEGRIYQPGSRVAARAGTFSWLHGRPVALLPAGQPGHFATLTAQGKVSVYRLHAGPN